MFWESNILSNNEKLKTISWKTNLWSEVYIDTIEQAKKDTKEIQELRSFFYSSFNLSYKENENWTIWNFMRWFLDWFLEFPAIVELAIKNSDFRDALQEQIKKLKISDFIDSVHEIFTKISNWKAYEKWKALTKILFMSTGILWLLKQFWMTVVKVGSKISIKKVAVWIWISWMHIPWYATEYKTKRDLEKLKTQVKEL